MRLLHDHGLPGLGEFPSEFLNSVAGVGHRAGDVRRGEVERLLRDVDSDDDGVSGLVWRVHDPCLANAGSHVNVAHRAQASVRASNTT